MYLFLLTFIHVAVSIVAALAGVVTMADMLRGRDPGGWATLFIWTAVFTSASGFLFPFTQLTPALIIGIAALLTMGVTLIALRRLRRTGHWRAIYAAGLVASLYWLTFVFIAEAFLRVPRIGAFAPTLGELPFAVAQAIALVAYVPLCWLVVRKFHQAAPSGTTYPA